MTTFELIKTIRNSLLTTIGSNLVYYNDWSEEFRLKEILNSLKIKTKIDPTDLTISEMNEIGFGIYNEENPIRLIPIWLYPFLTSNFDYECISGEKNTKLSKIDTNCRFGMLTYGVLPKKNF